MGKPTQTKPAPAPAPAPANQPAKSTAVATRPANEVAIPSGSFSEMKGAGFETVTRDDLAIPFLSILQSNSPEAMRSSPSYIDGAMEGLIINTVTKQIIDPAKSPLVLVACAYKRSFVEWRVREQGGGFVAEHDVSDGTKILTECERDEKNREIMPNGHQLNDTRTFYVMVLDPDLGPMPAVLAMTSTQIKKARQWNMQLNMLRLKDGAVTYTPPMFASKWKVDTVAESNEKGSWFGWRFTHEGFFDSPADPEFQACHDFHKSVQAGRVSVDLAKAGEPQIDPETGEIIGDGSSGEGNF